VEPPTPPAPPVVAEAPKPRSRPEEEMAFTVRPERFERKLQIEESPSSLKLPLVLAGIVLLAGGMIIYRTRELRSVNSANVVASTLPAKRESEARVAVAPVALHESPIAVPPAETVVAAKADVALAGFAAPEPARPAPAPVVEPGLLAVSSPTAADIYQGDKYLGSTPTTLQLPPGRQTIEYRHGDLRTVITHEMKSRETTTALVTFEVTVQINARPWAQVFVEGTARKALGQTPLSSVRVPIGSVLTFENPNFPARNHRVVENDSSIQVVFP